MWKAELERILISIGLNKTVVQNALVNNQLNERLQSIMTATAKYQSSITNTTIQQPRIGPLLYKVATKLPPGFDTHTEPLIQYIVQRKIKTDTQIEEAIKYLKGKAKGELNIQEFEKVCGVGIEVTREEIREALEDAVKNNKEAIKKQGLKFNFDSLQYEVKNKFKWANGKMIAEEIQNIKKNYSSLIENTNAIQSTLKEESKKQRLLKHPARDLPSALNSEYLLEEHKKLAPYPVITRFPPEPNGFLHIGHAKAMRYDFTLAEDYDGICYLRFDDTNPETESVKYIESIKDAVQWLGYNPYKVTFASDYFDQLFDFAITLIKKEKAYVCHQSQEEISKTRADCTESPWRNRSIEENLSLFEKMRKGKTREQEAVLRLKIDMKHSNPCMRDPVAYRTKHMSHPRTGNKWHIYPTYDFAHCICDSLEHITHSCCTLEFEIRRDLYYWLLNELDIYRPYVWEFSRLNVSYNMLSKRYLKMMIEEGAVKDWDDPRLLTLMGLKRRGVSPNAINEFCDLIGVTRRGNEMVVSQNLLDYCIRKDLDERAPRVMAVLDPLPVTLVNLNNSFEEQIEAYKFPKYPERGKEIYKLRKKIYIDRTDYQPEGGAMFHRLTRTQKAILKSAGWIKLVKEVRSFEGRLQEIEAEFHRLTKNKKVKGVIQWVADKYSLDAEIRLYDKLFNCEDPKTLGDQWRTALNKDSLKIIHTAKVWDNFINPKPLDCFQFERVGYFALDYDSNILNKHYVFNRTIGLADTKKKQEDR